MRISFTCVGSALKSSAASKTAQGVKVKLYDKPNALVQLGKRVGAFPNRYEHGGIDGNPIEHAEIKYTPKERARLVQFIIARAAHQVKQENKDG